MSLAILDLAGALRCIADARLAGAHNYLLLDAAGCSAAPSCSTAAVSARTT